MPKFSEQLAEEVEGGGAADCSATFAQLLNALRAEHEREVGDLLTEVRRLRLRVSSDRRTTGIPDAARYYEPLVSVSASATPCIPFMLCPLKRQSRPRPPGGRGKLSMAQASPTHQGAGSSLTAVLPGPPTEEAGVGTISTEEVVVGTISTEVDLPTRSLALEPMEWEKFPVNFTSSATDTKDLEQCVSLQHVTSRESTECAAVVLRRSSSGVSAGAAPSHRGSKETLRRGGSNETLSEERPPGDEKSLLWPIWDGALPSVWESEGAQSETWLQEALMARAASRSATDYMSRQLSQNHLRAKLPLMPTSRVKMVWDLAAPFALLYDLIMVPMHAFAFRETSMQRSIEAAILTYWLLDIPVAFNSAYFDEYGELVADYRKIARKYLRTWFTPDVLVTGLDFVTTCYIWGEANGSAAAHNMGAARLGKFLRVLRIIRIVRLGRLAKLRELVYGIQVYFDNEAVAIVWGLCGNLFLLLILNHINACLWYWVGSFDYAYTWLNSTLYQGDLTFADTDMWNQYFASLHWSLALFTPAGMSVQPRNLVERIYAVVSLLPGLVIFASFISHVTAGVTRLRQIQTQNLEQAFTLRRFLKENAISRDLVGRVTRYVSIAKKSHQKRIAKETVAHLKWLSGPLNVELMWELSAPTLRTHSFFEEYGGCSAAAMRQLCFSAIKVHSVSRRDTVFSSFENASCIYCIKAGSLVYRRAQGLNFVRRVRLQKGDWFVEHVLWMQWVHHGTMKALTESDLMSVDSETFRQVSRDHPDVLATCSEYAHEFLRRCQERVTCDVPVEIFERAVTPKREKSSWDLGRAKDFDITFSSDSDSGKKG